MLSSHACPCTAGASISIGASAKKDLMCALGSHKAEKALTYSQGSVVFVHAFARCAILHASLYTWFMSQILQVGLKRSIGGRAGIKQIIWQSIVFEKAVAQDNGFEFRGARAIASLNFKRSREAVKAFAGGSMISKPQRRTGSRQG